MRGLLVFFYVAGVCIEVRPIGRFPPLLVDEEEEEG